MELLTRRYAENLSGVLSCYDPFRLQVYCNGRSWLARRLSREAIDYTAAATTPSCALPTSSGRSNSPIRSNLDCCTATLIAMRPTAFVIVPAMARA